MRRYGDSKSSVWIVVNRDSSVMATVPPLREMQGTVVRIDQIALNHYYKIVIRQHFYNAVHLFFPNSSSDISKQETL